MLLGVLMSCCCDMCVWVDSVCVTCCCFVFAVACCWVDLCLLLYVMQCLMLLMMPLPCLLCNVVAFCCGCLPIRGDIVLLCVVDDLW